MVVKNPPANARETRVCSLGVGRCPGEENGKPLQHSCLGTPMAEESGGLRTVHVVTESDTTYRLNNSMITLPRTLMGKTDSMQEQMDKNQSKGNSEKNQNEMLEVKNTVNKNE